MPNKTSDENDIDRYIHIYIQPSPRMGLDEANLNDSLSCLNTYQIYLDTIYMHDIASKHQRIIISPHLPLPPGESVEELDTGELKKKKESRFNLKRAMREKWTNITGTQDFGHGSLRLLIY